MPYKPASLLLLLLLLGSCKPEYPEITEVKQFQIKSYNIFTRTLTVQYTPVVYNPNSFPLRIDRIDTDIWFDGAPFGKAQSNKSIDIRANGESEFQLVQQIKVDDLMSQLRTFMDKDSIVVLIDGRYSFKASSMELTIPYKYQSYILPKQDLQALLFGK